MFQFGSGTFYGVPLVAGNPAANPTPEKLAVLQDVSIDIGFELKSLFGQKQFPEAIARGKGKITGKAKFARVFADVFNQLMFGQTRSTPMNVVSVDESAAIPATPYQITPANAATFVLDLGVLKSSDGTALVRVASAPATGQYAVNSTTGVYTFAAADTTVVVLISYLYVAAAGVGVKIAVTNQLMGFQPQFEGIFRTSFLGKESVLVLYNCVMGKMTMSSKQDDFTIQELDFEAMADASGKVIDLHFVE